MNKKRFLVTGATGFCGSHLGPYLTSRGHEAVGTFQFKPSKQDRLRYKKLVSVDICQYSDISELIGRMKPYAVIHLAAQSNNRLSWQQVGATLNANVHGTLNVLEGIRRRSPKTRLLFISSSQVYGNTLGGNRRIGEKSPLNPKTPYAYSKVLGEMACLDYHKRFKIQVMIARAFNHFGEGQSPQYVFSDWCAQVAAIGKGLQRPEIEVGNLELRRDFLPVDDVLTAYECLALRGKAGEIYNVGSGKAKKLKKYLEAIKESLKKKIKIKVSKGKIRAYEPAIIYADNRKLRRFGWKPRGDVLKRVRDLSLYWRKKSR